MGKDIFKINATNTETIARTKKWLDAKPGRTIEVTWKGCGLETDRKVGVVTALHHGAIISSRSYARDKTTTPGPYYEHITPGSFKQQALLLLLEDLESRLSYPH